MIVKYPSALHQKGLKNYNTPDASAVVTEGLGNTTTVGSDRARLPRSQHEATAGTWPPVCERN
jgi:hypothetical protein